MISPETLLQGVLDGDFRLLSKAITLIESKSDKVYSQQIQLLDAIQKHTGNSLRIGITGIPGAGKSTFIEALGSLALLKGKKIAVLAIDPSSSQTGGSILGDKTRMEELSRKENVFIRPTPTSGVLGGISDATYDTIRLCEAAGYDIIIIETVGVGQSEVEIKNLVDVVLYIGISGAGDDLQGIKRGVMEIIDICFINKVDESPSKYDLAAKSDIKNALHLSPGKDMNWEVPVILGSAIHQKEMDTVWDSILLFEQKSKESGWFVSNRENQEKIRFEKLLPSSLSHYIKKNPDWMQRFLALEQKVHHQEMHPKMAVDLFYNHLLT